jgi:hypothetical protein
MVINKKPCSEPTGRFMYRVCHYQVFHSAACRQASCKISGILIRIYIYSVTGMKEARHTHYRNPDLCRVPESLPSAFYRALGKEDFAESRTRQRPALGKELVYRVQDTQHSVALRKDSFAERQTLGKDGSRQRFVSGCLQLTSGSLCRGPPASTRQSRFFAECHITGFYLPSAECQPALGKADSLPRAATVLTVLFAGFRNLPVQGRCCRNFLLEDGGP